MYDTNKNTITCGKNPGHTSFINFADFNISHLPSCYHDDDIFDLIKGQGHVTFRLTSTYISEKRPTKAPGSDMPYPFFDHRGRSNVTMRGSGWVEKVVKVTDKDGSLCPCESCRTADQPRKQWGEVWMRTAAHIVYDTSEARHTTCHFFYDSPETDLQQTLTFSGMQVVESDALEDWCQMKYVTHDLDLLDRLDQLCRRYDDLRDKVRDKFKDSLDQMKLAVIVSHPHGTSKKVTIGQWLDKEPMPGNSKLTQYTYDTPTCPGANGARVYIFGRGRGGFDHAHSGCREYGKNQSSFASEL